MITFNDHTGRVKLQSTTFPQRPGRRKMSVGGRNTHFCCRYARSGPNFQLFVEKNPENGPTSISQRGRFKILKFFTCSPILPEGLVFTFAERSHYAIKGNYAHKLQGLEGGKATGSRFFAPKIAGEGGKWVKSNSFGEYRKIWQKLRGF